jgi:hypothetical protein
MAKPYILPDRKAFADSIVRMFLNYKNKVIDPLDTFGNEEDACKRQGDASGKTRELLDHQKIVRDYLMQETPYRGLLLYHGLGSGKTCSSIAVAESLLSNRHVYVLTPASLQQNYREEIFKCGDPIYRTNNYWESKSLRSEDDRALAKSMGISDEFLDKNGRFYVTVPDRVSNYETLSLDDKTRISKQIQDVIASRFSFINYDGIMKSNVDRILPPDRPDMFNDSVIIVDEIHIFVGAVVNDSELKRKLYNMLYHAKNAKVVALSGTPIVNNPVEISYIMNLLRGPIEQISIPTKQSISWDEGMMLSFLRALKDVDTIEFNSVKRTILLTRNPPYFESVYNEKGERIAVKYNKELEFVENIKEWVKTWKSKFETAFGGTELETEDKYEVKELECLPTDFKEFVNLFIDGLNVKNALLFSRRIQGLVSYFRTADERLLPKEIDPEKRLTKVPMSDEQFLRYLEARKVEIDIEKSRALKRGMELGEDLGTYRMISRLVCNYALPPELKAEVQEAASEDDSDKLMNETILNKLKENPNRYLSEAGLAIYSPKMLAMLRDLKQNVGNPESFRNQFVYSYFRALQGLGIFSAVLEANGFQKYKLVKEQGQWKEDPSMQEGIPAFAFYTGEESVEERELMRQIFNEEYGPSFPSSLKDSIKAKRLCVLMATKAGATGINLRAVRNIYIMESHWNPSLIEQAIGRGIRLCSHYKLPKDERTVQVKQYMTVFSPTQITTQEGPNITQIRRNDMALKYYEGGEPRESFMSSDEYLYEISYKKGRINKSISLILKQSAIDCEIHRKLHSREQPVIQCLRFDTSAGPESLAYTPNYKLDETDALYLRNVQRKVRRLQKIKVKEIALVIDPDTNQVFDFPAFEDSQRLIQIGLRTAPNEIRFFTSVM